MSRSFWGERSTLVGVSSTADCWINHGAVTRSRCGDGVSVLMTVPPSGGVNLTSDPSSVSSLAGVYKPKTEDRRPKTEDRRPKTEDRRPKSAKTLYLTLKH